MQVITVNPHVLFNVVTTKHGQVAPYNITSIYVCTTREDNSFTNFLHLCQQQVKICSHYKTQRHANRIYGTPTTTLSENPFVEAYQA